MLPINSLDFDSEWRCDACGSAFPAEEVAPLVRRLVEEKDSLPRADLDGYVDFLRRSSRQLHPNHYLLNAARRWIIPLHCRVLKKDPASSSPSTPSEPMIREKVDMCQRYLFVLNRVEPGLTKNRGRLK